MKKKSVRYFKVISLGLIIFLATYFVSNNSFAKEESLADVNVPKLLPKKKATIILDTYAENKTKKVGVKLDSLLQRIHKQQDFHGAVLVAKSKNIIYKNQIGYADFSNKTPLNDASVFQLASVSKQFTAAAIMLLKEQNLLKLTDTVNTYFPNFPYKGVTIKNLLQHTAGLPKYFWMVDHEWNKANAPTNKDMMVFLEKTKARSFFKPGQNFNYSNTGYFVLASIVEKISGVSFGSFLEDKIFKPLEMTNTFVYSYQNDSVRNNQLDGYRLYKGWNHLKIVKTLNDAIVGDKNVYSNLIDLHKWTNGLNSGKLLTKESLELMYTNGETTTGREIPYGFGFRIKELDEQRAIYHHGKWNGFSTSITKYLKDDLVVIILEHTSFREITSLNENIKKIIQENFII